MEKINVEYEVYRRDDKTIVARGTKEECDDYAENDWQYSVRLVEQKLYTKEQVLELLSDILIDRDMIVNNDSINFIKFNQWVDDKL